MPIHKFVKEPLRGKVVEDRLNRSTVKAHPVEFMPKRVDGKIIVFAQEDIRIGWDPKMIELGLHVEIRKAPFFVSLPNELRHQKFGLINSIITESYDNVIVSIGKVGVSDNLGSHSILGRRRRGVSAEGVQSFPRVHHCV